MAIRFYLGGPMSGYPDHNFPAFKRAAKIIRDKFDIPLISPAEMSGLPENADKTWEWHMARDIRFVLDLDGIILLPGWADSKGARMEVYNALCLGKDVVLFREEEHGAVIDEVGPEKIWAEWLDGQTKWLLKEGLSTAITGCWEEGDE